MLIALLIIKEIESISIGDHDRFNEALRFLIYNVFNESQYPKASLHDPDLAPKFVVLLASNVPALSIPGE